jgi:hypothetical protein
LDALW